MVYVHIVDIKSNVIYYLTFLGIEECDVETFSRTHGM